MEEEGFAKTTSSSRDREKSCRSWASAGECGSNAAFMLERCARSCEMAGAAAAKAEEPGAGIGASATADRHPEKTKGEL